MDASLSSLSNSSQLRGAAELFGSFYVAEVKKDGIYRTYTYLNPDY